jgi:hypothetical protein
MKSSNLRAKLARSPQAKLLNIVYRRVEELTPDPGNPRRHAKKQIRQIANSIKAFGFIVPVLIDRDAKVIAGHGRLLAARELGIVQVPTLCLDHLTPAQANAFIIADNRLTEIASWDDQLLAQHLKELTLLDLDFSIELTGFEMAETTCGSLHSTTRPSRLTIPPMPCPSRRWGCVSASSAIYGASAATAFCAAMPGITMSL